MSTESRFHQLFEQIESVSVQGYDRHRRLIYWNPASEALYGYSAEGALGRQLEDLIIPDPMREAVIAGVEAWVNGGLPVPAGELTLRRADGSPIHVFSSHVMLRGPDGESQMYCVDVDLSEQKRTAEELEQYRLHLEELVEKRTAQLSEAREQAEAANQAKSAFLANMSHEIRTPMNAILGLTHLLGRELASATQRETLEKIDHAANHLLSIINDILDVSKIEAGKFNLHPHDFPTQDLFRQVESIIQAQIQAKGLALDLETDRLPSVLHGDLTRLRQALLNYLSNAIKFTRRGRITLRVRVLEETQTDLLVRFEVVDTGIGIAPDDLACLFQPFSQVDNSSTRRYAGTGLGLVITQRLARLMGGEAGAESRVGQGSCFWLTARLGKGSGHDLEGCWKGEDGEDGEDVEIQLKARFAGARVLVAEDNPINQEVIAKLLVSVGLRVDLAADGKEAVEMACMNGYELILMDIQMPEIDGLEATRVLRGRPAWRPCPLIAMTANAFEEDRERCLASGMDDHLPKPVDPRRLYGVMMKWLSRRPSAQASGVDGATDRPCEPSAQTDGAVSVIERLSQLPGVDVDFGVANLHGQVALYSKVLRKYAEHHIDDVRQLREALRSGDLDRAYRMAHTLKGVSGTLGFVQLQSLMTELVAGIRQARSAVQLEAQLATAEVLQAELIEAVAVGD